VVDAEGRVACIRSGDSKVVCFDLATGAQRFCFDQDLRPLLIDKGRLLAWSPAAQKHRIYLHLLDLEEGVEQWRIDVELPDWVDSQPQQAHEFGVEAQVLGEELILSWRAHGAYKGGAAPSEGLLESMQNDAAARLSIDVRSGQVLAVEEMSAAVPEPQAFGLEALSLLAPYKRGGAWRNEAWVLGDVEVSLEQQSSSGEPGLFLVHRRVGDGAFVAEHKISSQVSEVHLSPDGAWLFVPSTHAGARGDGLVLAVFLVASGDRIATLPDEPELDEITLVDQVVICTTEQASDAGWQLLMKARDLKSGALLWTRVLRSEQALPGPPPPPPMPP